MQNSMVTSLECMHDEKRKKVIKKNPKFRESFRNKVANVALNNKNNGKITRSDIGHICSPQMT